MTEANRKSTCPPGVGREIRLPAGRGAGNPKSEIIRVSADRAGRGGRPRRRPLRLSRVSRPPAGMRAWRRRGRFSSARRPGAARRTCRRRRGRDPPSRRPREAGRRAAWPMYASQAAPEEVIRFYRAEMPRLGWTERKLQARRVRPGRPDGALVLECGGRFVYHCGLDPAGGGDRGDGPAHAVERAENESRQRRFDS